MMKKPLLVGLAGLLAAGCQFPGLSPMEGAPRVPFGAMENHGVLRIQFNWPSTATSQVQAIPVVAMRAEITVVAANGETVAVRDVSRSGASGLTTGIDLTPDTGYTVSAKLFDENGVLVAVGTSAPFSIQRQRVVSVDLTVSAAIAHVAGTGLAGYTGDGGPAAVAQLNLPYGLAIASNGDILIADESNHAIRRLDANGTLTTLVGTGVRAAVKPVLGVNVPLAEATFNAPNAIAVAPNGDLLIADMTNGAIRVLPAENGQRYGQALSVGYLQTIFKSTLSGPTMRSVTVDREGNVIAIERHRIFMITADGTEVPLAGKGASVAGPGLDGPALGSELFNPDGMVIDASGNLIFSEFGNDRIRMLCREPGNYFGIPMASGSVFTIAGEGNETSESVPLGDGKDALEASFTSPRGLAIDERGNVYIADSGNQRVRVLSPARQISTLAGTGARTQADLTDLGDEGPAARATFANPRGLLLHQGYLFVSDSNNYRVRKIPL